MKKVVQGLGLEIYDMTKSLQNDAHLDGGDVIFTGSEFFVGHSTRSNPLGADFMREAFSNYPVHMVPVPPNGL